MAESASEAVEFASEVAQSSHIPGRHMAKTVIVDVDGELAMAVLPSDQYLDPDNQFAKKPTERFS